MSIKLRDEAERPKTLSKTKFDVKNGYAKIRDLHFWEDNPRIYSILEQKRDEDELNKSYIFSELRRTSDFNSLLKDIKADGFINEALWVVYDKDSKNYVVYEGNTRLAVSMQLFETTGDKKWSEIEVNVMPDTTDHKFLKKLVGTVHLKGKNKWQPFEAKGWLYRETIDARATEGSISKAQKKVAKDYDQKITDVKNAYNLVSFFNDYKLGPAHQKSHFSYWEEVVKQPALQKVRNYFNNPENTEGEVENSTRNQFDKLLIKKIIEGVEVKRVSAGGGEGAFRKDIKVISEAFTKNGDKELIFDLLNNKYSIQNAVLQAEAGGSNDNDYQYVKEFSIFMHQIEKRKALRSSLKKYPDMTNILGSITESVQAISIDIDSLRKKTKK